MPVLEHVAETLHQLELHPATLGLLPACDVVPPTDREDERPRHDEAPDVRENRVRRRKEPDERAGDSGPSELSDRRGALKLRVAVDELLARDQGGEVRLVRDVEEHRQHADDERDREQLPDAELAECVCDRNRSERERATHVADDQDGAPGQPVDPHPRGEREQQERQLLEDRERCDRERARMEDVDRDQRQREQAELRAELADRLACPELQKVPVPPESASWPEVLQPPIHSANRR